MLTMISLIFFIIVLFILIYFSYLKIKNKGLDKEQRKSFLFLLGCVLTIWLVLLLLFYLYIQFAVSHLRA